MKIIGISRGGGQKPPPAAPPNATLLGQPYMCKKKSPFQKLRFEKKWADTSFTSLQKSPPGELCAK